MPFDGEAMGIVDDAVEDGVRDGGIAEPPLMPPRDRLRRARRRSSGVGLVLINGERAPSAVAPSGCYRTPAAEVPAGAIEGRPLSAQAFEKSPSSAASTSFTTDRTSRNGCLAGTRFSRST